MKIQPVVEGHGEVEAVPVLLRRLLSEVGAHEIGVAKPIRQSRHLLVHEHGLRRAIRLARLQLGCAAILVLLDSDDDCPKSLSPQLREWAQAEAGGIPCEIVMAHREFEAWFLAGIESLRGVRGIRLDASAPATPEGPRSAKDALEGYLEPGRGYIERVDQPALTQRFDMGVAHRGCRSFRHMAKAFATLVSAVGFPIVDWPPTRWQ